MLETTDALPSDDERIEEMSRWVARELCQLFGHEEGDARRMFETYHQARSGTSTWSDADYYDHESPGGIALEVEFERLTGVARRHAQSEFIDWRSDYYLRRRHH